MLLPPSLSAENEPWLDIFVLCHNRPGLARETIRSILGQNEGGYRLIISDNSTNDQVAEMLWKNFPTLTRVERGGIPPFEHFNACIADAKANYFCLFHDDDLMSPNFIQTLRQAADRYPQAVALGTNAWVVELSNGTRELGLSGFGEHQVIQSPVQLFRRYFGRHQTGIVPFPSYIYQTKHCQTQRMLTHGGKYADVSWLLHLASLGPIVWCHTPSMEYHLHGTNDGQQESIRDRLRFLGYIKQHPEFCGRRGLVDYRYFLYQKCLAAEKKRSRKRPNRIQWIENQLEILRSQRRNDLRDGVAWIRKLVIKTFHRNPA